jgi:hypothetical protein
MSDFPVITYFYQILDARFKSIKEESDKGRKIKRLHSLFKQVENINEEHFKALQVIIRLNFPCFQEHLDKYLLLK